MKKLTDIIEAASSVHPDAIHVSDAGGGKYKVHAVGKNFAHGLKPGEILRDPHLDDATEMGARIVLVDAPKKKTVKQIEEGTEAHAQFQKYHNDVAGMLKGIGKAMSKHYDNVTDKKNWHGGQAQWDHVEAVKGVHRQLQDLHDGVLRNVEWTEPPKPAKLKESVEPEADMNILVQLRKCVDILEHGTQGGADVTFGDGETTFVNGETAKKIVEAIEKLKPETRAEVAEYLYQTHDNLVGVYSRLK